MSSLCPVEATYRISAAFDERPVYQHGTGLSTYHTTLQKTSQMSATVTERKVDHAAAEMLEEPFIRVRALPLSSCNDMIR
jgi:hypothetical protein